jgi:hypothetical protein
MIHFYNAKLFCFTPCILLLLSSLATALPGPDFQSADLVKRESVGVQKRSLERLGFGNIEFLPAANDATAIEYTKRASAGLAWKIQEGPVKVYLTNPHTG